MATEPAEDFWPQPLLHCSRPLVTAADIEITIGEISWDAVDGFMGDRMLYTALVPTDEVDSVLKAVGGIGHGVSSDTTHRTFGIGSGYLPAFWIYGPTGSKRFESLIHSWWSHDKIVLLPDDALLMCYDLTPRIMKNGSISWDDLGRPVYDVVRVNPLSTCSTSSECTTARVTILREYLEDYLSLKGCAAVATYWDERFSSNDPQVAAYIGEQGAKFKQPGRELWFLHAQRDFANQVSQVWGCALLLAPTGRPISDPPEPELTWPDRETPVKGRGMQGSFSPFELVWVRDEVLAEYEKRDEFEISPEHGFVSYGDRWSVSYCERSGRNYIELELRKFYEGAPFDVIRHYSSFAVTSAVAERDCQIYGTRHIGIRAKDLAQAFLQLTATLSQLSDAAGLSFTQEDIGHLSAADIAYKGWWTLPSLKPLGHVVPLSLPSLDFLSRCAEVFKLFENLQPAPLRQILLHLGLKKEDTVGFAGLRLLATTCQLAALATEAGLDLISDCRQISASWDPERILAELRPAFALNSLRTTDAHKFSTSTPMKILNALEGFGVDETQCRAGWGLALDQVYDQTIASLESIARLLQGAMER